LALVTAPVYTTEDETSFQRYGSRTYAQHGEDIVFCIIFDRLGIDKPSYLDIGAFHPSAISNTRLLYERGSRGINVEANPHLIAAFLKHRPDDLNLCCAVGPRRQRSKPFYLAENPGLSSFDKAMIDVPIVGEIPVPVWTVPDILIGHRGGRWPDLVSIDIEGGDLEALHDCLPAHDDRPSVICIEAIPAGRDRSKETRQFMTDRGYFVFSWNVANMVFVKAEHHESLR
jgi:FkbM family methyltransferase